jgi:integrase
MASKERGLYRPNIVTYRLPDGSYRTPDGQRVTKDTPGAVRTVEESRKWYGRYVGANGEEVRTPLAETKDVSRRMLNKLRADAQLERVGIKDAYAGQRRLPLPEHLEDFGRFLASKGATPKHIRTTLSFCRKVIGACKFDTLDDIKPAPVVDFLAGLAEQAPARALLTKDWYTRGEAAALLDINPTSLARLLRRVGHDGQGNGRARRYPREALAALQGGLCRGLGVSARNHYLTALKSFTKWLRRDQRTPSNPLEHLQKQNADLDVRHPRRALPEASFLRFVQATAAGKTFRGLTGHDRLLLYILAANTGFRLQELASLSPASFDLDRTPPTVTVEAACSKHRRRDVQPLRSDVAELFRPFLAGKSRRQMLWPGSWTWAAADMVRRDLAAAGLPYEDEDGRSFDFHALRGQFITMLAASGVHPKIAQTLARHSTITLTMDYYTHLDLFNVAGALDKLPVLPTAPPTREREERHA